MDSTQAQVRARDLAIDRLNQLTKWIAAGALVALGLFGVIAAQTIPGKPSTSPGSTSGSQSTGAPAAITSLFHHHHRDGGTVTSASAPPVAVTGGSR